MHVMHISLVIHRPKNHTLSLKKLINPIIPLFITKINTPVLHIHVFF